VVGYLRQPNLYVSKYNKHCYFFVIKKTQVGLSSILTSGYLRSFYGIRTFPLTNNSPRTIPRPDDFPIKQFPDRTFPRLKFIFYYFFIFKIIFIRCYVHGFFLTRRIIFFLLSRLDFYSTQRLKSIKTLNITPDENNLKNKKINKKINFTRGNIRSGNRLRGIVSRGSVRFGNCPVGESFGNRTFYIRY